MNPIFWILVIISLILIWQQAKAEQERIKVENETKNNI